MRKVSYAVRPRKVLVQRGHGELIAEMSHRATPELVSEVVYKQQLCRSRDLHQGESLGQLSESRPLRNDHVQLFNDDARRTL